MTTYLVTCTTEVRITIDDSSTAITRATENIDDWHDAFRPPITTVEQVVGYLAAAAIQTGADDASRLDGWADLDRGQVTMYVVGASDPQIAEAS